MIYTITFNPALDYTVQVEKFEIGKINRTKSENILAGGKGLNVSIILKRLGIENTALSFIAGFTGKELERKIRQYNIETEFIETNRGYTRINVKISSLEKNSLIQESETALNGNGPEITEDDIEKLLQKIQNISLLNWHIPPPGPAGQPPESDRGPASSQREPGPGPVSPGHKCHKSPPDPEDTAPQPPRWPR